MDKRKKPTPQDIKRVIELLEEVLNDECVIVQIRRDGDKGIHSQQFHTLRTAEPILKKLKLLQP